MSYRQFDATGREVDSFTDRDLNPQRDFEILTLGLGESLWESEESKARIIRIK